MRLGVDDPARTMLVVEVQADMLVVVVEQQVPRLDLGPRDVHDRVTQMLEVRVVGELHALEPVAAQRAPTASFQGVSAGGHERPLLARRLQKPRSEEGRMLKALTGLASATALAASSAAMLKYLSEEALTLFAQARRE